jgi:YidC/Oxa1 family membrane protein insertase
MMKFYKENDVNPFGSCLPLVAQAPVFIALYYTLRNSASTFADGTDLGFLRVIPNISDQLTEIGWAVIPLVAVYAVSQLISSELSSSATMSKNQRWLMRLLPIGIVFFVFQFPVPAGLVIYWATTNLWTAGQQLVLKRRIEAEIEVQGDNGSSAAVVATDTDDDVIDEPEETASDVATTAAVARAVPKRRRRQGDPPPPPPVDEVEAQPDEPSQPVSGENGSTSGDAQGSGSTRTPPARKRGPGGGPSRPAGKKKPPKRRK